MSRQRGEQAVAGAQNGATETSAGQLEAADDRLAEQVTAATNRFEILPALWNQAAANEDPEVMSDLMGSITPEKIAFNGDDARTPFGCSAKALFGPETAEIASAEPE